MAQPPNNSITHKGFTSWLYVAGLILAMGVFHTLTIKSGHLWGDDFAMYILHARNIAEGIAYDNTGYIFNPDAAVVGPGAYPPVFPILLSPILATLGLNLTAMKLTVMAMFLVSLVILSLVWRDRLPTGYLLAAIALVGFNPYFWFFKNNVLSDIPFLPFLYASFLLVNRTYDAADSPGQRSGQTLAALGTGLLIYLAYGTRTIGLVLIPILFVFDILRSRRITAFPIMASAAFSSLALGQAVYFHHSAKNFAALLTFEPALIPRYLSSLVYSFHTLFDNGYITSVAKGLFAPVLVMAIIGYLTTLRERVGVGEIFVPVYVLALLPWPFDPQGLRYSIPLIPLFMLYAYKGIWRVSLYGRESVRSLALAALSLAIALSYVGKYTTVDYGPIGSGVYKPESVDLFAHVRQSSSERDVFIFEKPKALALFTGRRAAAPPGAPDEGHLWKYIREIRATHLIVPANDTVLPDSTVHLRRFADNARGRLEEVYTNRDFRMYRIQSLPEAPAHASLR